jgi:hypothetical protein
MKLTPETVDRMEQELAEAMAQAGKEQLGVALTFAVERTVRDCIETHPMPEHWTAEDRATTLRVMMCITVAEDMQQAAEHILRNRQRKAASAGVDPLQGATQEQREKAEQDAKNVIDAAQRFAKGGDTLH